MFTDYNGPYRADCTVGGIAMWLFIQCCNHEDLSIQYDVTTIVCRLTDEQLFDEVC